jgi:hypothetical protein
MASQEDRYLEDVTQHTNWVVKYITEFIHQLEKRGEQHDADKFASPIKDVYSKNFDALMEVPYGSEEYNRITGSSQFKAAFKQHTENNRHHTQHFKNGVDDMNLVDVVEMLCDWKAASDRSKTSILDGMKLNYKKYKIDGTAQKWLENTIKDLGWA